MIKPIKNIAICKKCGDVIESKHVHDFTFCKCGSIAIDGGHEYQRVTGDPEDYDLSLSKYVDDGV